MGSSTLCLDPRTQPPHSSVLTTGLGQLQDKEVTSLGRTRFEGRFRGCAMMIFICMMYVWRPHYSETGPLSGTWGLLMDLTSQAPVSCGLP